jgi:hypothetical protein
MLLRFAYSMFRLTVYPIFITLITAVTAIITIDPFESPALQCFAIGNIAVALWRCGVYLQVPSRLGEEQRDVKRCQKMSREKASKRKDWYGVIKMVLIHSSEVKSPD